MSNCEFFLQNTYYNTLNQVGGTQASYPYPVFWFKPTVFCEDSNFFALNYTQIAQFVITGETFDLSAISGYNFKSNPLTNFYIPETQSVIINGTTYVGPILIENASHLDPQVSIQQLVSWHDEQINMCNGNNYSLGGKDLTVYDISDPTGRQNCDVIMKAICLKSENASNIYCSCFTGEVRIAAAYPTLTNISVICFDQACALNGYKTDEMVKESCSPAVCEETIKNDGGEITGITEIYCDGSIYQLPTPNPAVTPTETPSSITNSSKSIPTFVWGLITVAIILIIVTVSIFFWKKK
jgi:hypothetical protein